ncbi:MAG: Na(+)-translocating NADH-quinone reductase subunit A [Candidatus Hydrogenedentota bacterium]|nr:MAG: Na(+)-translocating NADH-quinone reductase subunit A [Candidatus Hydrogenedentota bacterium]
MASATVPKFRIKKGLDIPIKGEPQIQGEIEDKTNIKKVAIVGPDYIGMKPALQVQVGDIVKKGQLLFTDKKCEGVCYTAPAAGKVVEINRGERRVFLSLVIEVDDSKGEQSYDVPDVNAIANVDLDKLKKPLVESGMWTALRSRPYGKVANPNGDLPAAIFVTAFDSDPLAPPVEPILKGQEENFEIGLRALSRFTEGKLWVCESPKNTPMPLAGKAEVAHFSGKHPAGLPGTHIHFLEPVSLHKFVWHIHYQDVMAWGEFLKTGTIPSEKVIALTGPRMNHPRLIKTRIGASIAEITTGELGENADVIAGSCLSGRRADGPLAYLGKYHNQVTALVKGGKRELLGWHMPGFHKFSITNVFASSLIPGKKYEYDTSLHGGHRAIVPIGVYEKVMPLDILPTQLLKALAMRDSDLAADLGALELIEEDLALCTFVCPGKNDYGPMLREVLTVIEKEG